MDNNCQCGSGQHKHPVLDARGIFLCYACDTCMQKKLSGYRSDVMSDPDYWTDEPVEEEF